MSLDTYTSLKTEIGNWLDRDDLTSYLDTFLALAEERIFQDLRVRELEARDTATLSTSSRYIALPPRFIEMRRLHFTSTTPLHRLSYVSPEKILDYYVSGTTKPDYFTVIGSEVEFEALPDTTYTVEMAFYQKPVALSSTNSTNTILTNYPALYLYGCLSAAEPFLQNEERLPLWKSLYAESMALANETSDRGRHSGSSLAMRSNVSNP